MPCEIWEPVLPLAQLGTGTPAKPSGHGRTGNCSIPHRTLTGSTSGAHLDTPGALSGTWWHLHPGETELGAGQEGAGSKGRAVGAAESTQNLLRARSLATNSLQDREGRGAAEGAFSPIKSHSALPHE